MGRLYTILSILSVFLPLAFSLCSHPCSRVNRGTFVDGTNTFVFGCNNTSVVQVFNDGKFLEGRECYARLGPFLVFRVGNSYQCFKDMVYDTRTNIVFVYFGERTIIASIYVLEEEASVYGTYPSNPSICDVCSGPLRVAVIVAQGQDLAAARRLTPPPLGCNRPPNCPILDRRNDVPCSGCEPKEDDGLCCSSCQRPVYG